MSYIKPTKEMHSEPEALEGGRRPTGKASGDTSKMSAAPNSNPEVSPSKSRRAFTATYKLKILDELDRCTAVGEKGAVMRREGLYSSQITDWRRQREEGALTALNKARGRKKVHDTKDQTIAMLEKEIEGLKNKLAQAETIIDVQKKVSEIFGIGNQIHSNNETKS